MKVKNILILSLGGTGNAPVASAKGLFDKYSARPNVKFIAWFHLHKEGGNYTRRQLYRNPDSEVDASKLPEFASFGNAELGAIDAKDFYEGARKEKDDSNKVVTVPGKIVPQTGDNVIWPEGSMGAIIVAHGSVSSAGTLSSTQLADMLSKFRTAYKVPSLKKIVFDVCSVGRVSEHVAPKVPVGDDRKFFVVDRDEDGVPRESPAIELVAGGKLSFLQDFLYKYGEHCRLAGEDVDVKVAGWDEGVSVYHPDNELNRKVEPTSINRDIVEGLKVGQKYLAERSGERPGLNDVSVPLYKLKLINSEVRNEHKRMYNYVITSGVRTVTELRLDCWHDLEFA
ncbi:hypothetical protein [Pseudomonas sp. NPDC089534]|uniref:hypothetical protein n=1 Tax=Pseudomonas sp. NPDC089534 TaxID=3364468 RepID=UPI0037FE00CD